MTRPDGDDRDRNPVLVGNARIILAAMLDAESLGEVFAHLDDQSPE